MAELRNLIQMAIMLGVVALPAAAQAQWWSSRAPVDYEDCAEAAAKTATSKEARAPLLAQCEAKFAGRRKPGGGYTYFDFMQNRHFDIAGPNPTADELRTMDEHYTAYLDQRKKQMIAAAFAAKQKQQAALAQPAQAEPARPVVEPPRRSEARPRPAAKRHPRASRPRPRPHRVAAREPACQNDPLACGWSRLAAGVDSVKRTLLGPPPARPRRN